MAKDTQTLVQESGILSHLKTVGRLKLHGWSVNISSYYYDDVADLVKEIDIIAEKQFNSFEPRPDGSRVQLNIQLFIECKYIDSEVVVWFDEMNRKKAVSMVGRRTGLKIAERQSGNISPDELHYLRTNRVAKLFSANANKEDLVYKGVSQCLRAQVYYQQWAAGPISHAFNDRSHSIIVRYPIVICDNFQNMKEIEVKMSGKFSTTSVPNPFLLETNYVYFNKDKTSTRDEYFLIDFMDIDAFDSFLPVLETEAKTILRSHSLLVD